MKIILSRKGFDSGSGGYASPILNNGKLLSFPIPDKNSNILYIDLFYKNDSYYDIISSLTKGKIKSGKKRPIQNSYTCHLDPDIRTNILKSRLPGWKPILGQQGKAQKHLSSFNINVDDIFLFFGWFKDAQNTNGIYNYINGSKDVHIIFGYLQIGEIINLPSQNNLIKKWMNYHPHVSHQSERTNNTIYIARDTLSWNSNKPGAANFSLNNDLILTENGKTKSQWELPNIFSNPSDFNIDNNRKPKITKNSNGNVLVDSNLGNWQECVFESENIVNWVKKLIDTNTIDNE